MSVSLCLHLFVCVRESNRESADVRMSASLSLFACVFGCVLKTIRTSSHFDKAERHNP